MVRVCSTGAPGSVLRSLQPFPPSTQHYRPQGPDKHPCRYWGSQDIPHPATPSSIHSKKLSCTRALNPLPATSTGKAFWGLVHPPDDLCCTVAGSEQSCPISEAVWFLLLAITTQNSLFYLLFLVVETVAVVGCTQWWPGISHSWWCSGYLPFLVPGIELGWLLCKTSELILCTLSHPNNIYFNTSTLPQ